MVECWFCRQLPALWSAPAERSGDGAFPSTWQGWLDCTKSAVAASLCRRTPYMIIDLQRFVAAERPCWAELERALDKLEAEPNYRMALHELQHFHRLYERTAAD